MGRINVLQFEDLNGNNVFVEESEVQEYIMSSDFKIYGCRPQEILNLRKMYMSLGGEMPMSPESINKLIELKAGDPSGTVNTK